MAREQWTPEEKLVKARIDFIHNDCVFLGNLALRLKLIDATKWVPTAATDFKHMYFNRDFIGRCTLDETKFVIAHEVMHNVYDHCTRTQQMEMDKMLANMAQDYVINLELKDLAIGSFPSSKTMIDPEFEKLLEEHDPKAFKKYKKEMHNPGVCCEEKYRGMCSEEVYLILKKDKDENGGSGQGDGPTGHDMHMDGDGGGGEGDEECEDCEGSGKGDGENGECTSCNGSGKDNTGKHGPVTMTQEEIDRMPDEMRKAVMDAAKVAESADGSAGNVPLGVKQLIDEWTESRIDWRDYLNNVVQSTLKSDYTWMRQSRKSVSTNYYLPAMDNDEMVSVDVAIDTSGSMSNQMLRDLMGEVKGIMEQFADFRLRAWCFDTKCYKVYEYGPDTLDEIDEFELEGGGGTMFEANWEMMKENDLVPDQLIVMTDGCPCGGWGDELWCPTVFLIHTYPEIEAPLGETVHYEEAAID